MEEVDQLQAAMADAVAHGDEDAIKRVLVSGFTFILRNVARGAEALERIAANLECRP